MADNVPTYTGFKVATDQSTNTTDQEQYQIVKVAFGARDTNTFTVAASNAGLPTEDAPVRRLLELVLLEMRIFNEQLAVLTGRQVESPENQRGL